MKLIRRFGCTKITQVHRHSEEFVLGALLLGGGRAALLRPEWSL